MKKIIQFTLFILCQSIFLNSPYAKPSHKNTNEVFYDLFPGTVIQKGDELYLHTCQSIDLKFKLNFNDPKDKRTIQKLLQKYNQFWVYLSANATDKNKVYIMDVDGIYKVFPNQTCHLRELLHDLAENSELIYKKK